MDLIYQIEEEIKKLKNNEYGILVYYKKSSGIITMTLTIPLGILKKEISEMKIEFQVVIDTNGTKVIPKLYCLSPYCYPHFADGRDLFYELKSTKNPKQNFTISNLLNDILQFIKLNFEKGCLYFFGKYYLGNKYDLKIFQKGCQNIINIKENLSINGKNVKLNRLLILSDVYFLLFEQEKWNKNNLTLIFWSSINNIQKVQKVKETKTLILQWSQKDDIPYSMSINLPKRDEFIQILLDKMHHFGMVYNVTKVDENQPKKSGKKNNDIVFKSQNVKLISDYNKQNAENEEDEDDEEGEEIEDEEDKNKETKITVIDNTQKTNKDNNTQNMNKEKENDKNKEIKKDEIVNKEDKKDEVVKEKNIEEKKEGNGDEKNIIEIKDENKKEDNKKEDIKNEDIKKEDNKENV